MRKLALFLPFLLLVAGFASVSADPAEPETLRGAGESSLLADLPPATLKSIDSLQPSPSAAALLSAVYETSEPHDLDTGALVVRADTRWRSRPTEAGPAAPLAELYRWPGDTVLALYAMTPQRDPATEAPPLPQAESFRAVRVEPDRAEWHGTFSSELGEQRVIWIERTIGDGLPRLGALILPGDAGLGAAGTAGLIQEALFVLSRVEVRHDLWRALPRLARGGTLHVPELAAAPGDGNEKTHPWQVAAGVGFTLGLPSGLRVRKLDAETRPPAGGGSALLWLRGRFQDLAGDLVVLGDGSRAGYVARVEAAAKPWVAGTLPPIGVPRGRLVGRREFELAEDATTARKATAERWSEEGFVGEWLVFRLSYGKEGFEVGLPVVSGWRSPSLFWIPATFRREGEAPAPPPFGPEERFGIRYDPITEDLGPGYNWVAGLLTVPGMRMDVAVGWHPSVNLYSAEGYPVRFLGLEGRWRARLTWVAGGDVAELVDARAGFEPLKKPGRYHAARVLADEIGAHLFVTEAGHAFLFEPEPDALIEATQLGGGTFESGTLWQLMMRSVLLER